MIHLIKRKEIFLYYEKQEDNLMKKQITSTALATLLALTVTPSFSSAPSKDLEKKLEKMDSLGEKLVALQAVL